MFKENDWVRKAQLAAAQSLDLEKQNAAQAALQQAEQARRLLQETLEKDTQARQLLELYLQPLDKYVRALLASGYHASAAISVETFRGIEGHVQFHEDFMVDELNREAERSGIKDERAVSSLSYLKDVHKKSRVVSPLSLLNKRDKDDGSGSYTVWDSSAITFSLQKAAGEPQIKMRMVIGRVKDIQHAISTMTGASGGGKNQTYASIRTKIISEVEQPPCIVIRIPTINLHKPHSSYDFLTYGNYIAYSPEEFDLLMADQLASLVTSLEILHLQESEKAQLTAQENTPKKKKIWGIF